MKAKIIQIMPIDGMYAVYKVKQGEAYGEIKSKIICLALDEKGEIWAIDRDADGVFGYATDASNFVGFEYKGD